MSALASHFVRVGGLRLHARVGGLDRDGAPLVLVHGLGVSGRYLEPLARELASAMPVLVPDLPGFGRSGRPRRVPDVAGLAGALADWLEAVSVARAVVLGNSMGCQVAVELALREPARVAGLVLVAPTVDPRARGWLRQGRRLLADSAREPPSLLRIIAREYATFGLRRLAATARFALADRIEDKLPRVQAPALVIRGGRDPLVPQRWAEEAASLLPRGRLAVVPGEPHACHYTAPRAVAELVRTLV